MQVYDVTPFVIEHPGGDAIMRNAGADSTMGFYGCKDLLPQFSPSSVMLLLEKEPVSYGICFRHFYLSSRNHQIL